MTAEINIDTCLFRIVPSLVPEYWPIVSDQRTGQQLRRSLHKKVWMLIYSSLSGPEQLYPA